VLFLNWRDLSHPQGGGSERYVEQLGGLLAAGGDDVIIHCAAHPCGPEHETRDGIRFYRRGSRLTVYPHGLLAVRRHRPDLVVDVSNGIPFFSPLVHRRVVLVIHHVSRETWWAASGPVLRRVGWFIESKVVPWAYRRARYIAVSGPTRDDIVALGIPPAQVSVVHNATEPVPTRALEPARPARSGPPTLCVVARLVPNKQVHHAVEVLALLAGEFPDLRLRVVGAGPARAHILARAEELGVADRVDLLGGVDDATKHEVLATASVHLCLSVKEGWGRVVMEAAAHEVPTVAYRASGGLRESVRDGETGLLADDVLQMAMHTGDLLRNPARRAAMGRAAYHHAATFTPERTIAEFHAACGLESTDNPHAARGAESELSNHAD
jgi:glycosyltransferase involved in cell wall biosynthesis